MYQEEVEPDVFEPLYNTTSPTVAGAGTDGYLPGVDSTGTAIGTDAKKGAIVLAPASPYTSFNGGSILLQLPSCYHLSVFLSAESSIRPALKGGFGELEPVDCANIKSFIFLAYHGAGQCTWEVQDIENASGFKLNQQQPVTAQILNGNQSSAEMYLQGMKVQIYGEGAGIAGTQADSDRINIAQTGRFISLSRKANITGYNAGGKEVLSARAEALDLGALGTGLYIVQARDNNAVSTQKVLIP